MREEEKGDSFSVSAKTISEAFLLVYKKITLKEKSLLILRKPLDKRYVM